MKPSDFTIFPIASMFGVYEAERVAFNIMLILKRTGNTFRQLSWDEYKLERMKDGAFSENEKTYFDQVQLYCMSPASTRFFCADWKKIYEANVEKTV